MQDEHKENVRTVSNNMRQKVSSPVKIKPITAKPAVPIQPARKGPVVQIGKIVEYKKKDEKTGEYVVARKFARGAFLGKGGFAMVYELTDMDTGILYAAKAVSKSSFVKKRAKQKLITEIKLHRMLKHNHIVRFEMFFEDSANVYILMEMCHNKSMVELLKCRNRLSEEEVRYYMLQVLDAVQHMHDQRIIHRDLKLGNLFLNKNLEIKIGDFGLATKLKNDSERRRTLCGTPNYIAPEILNRDDKGHSYEVDIWSIGVIFYTLIIGRPPFETASVKTTYQRIQENVYTFPENVPISSAAEDLIRTILHPVPEMRPSIKEILAHPFFTGFTPSSLPPNANILSPGYSKMKLSQRTHIDKPSAARSLVEQLIEKEGANFETKELKPSLLQVPKATIPTIEDKENDEAGMKDAMPMDDDELGGNLSRKRVRSPSKEPVQEPDLRSPLAQRPRIVVSCAKSQAPPTCRRLIAPDEEDEEGPGSATAQESDAEVAECEEEKPKPKSSLDLDDIMMIPKKEESVENSKEIEDDRKQLKQEHRAWEKKLEVEAKKSKGREAYKEYESKALKMRAESQRKRGEEAKEKERKEAENKARETRIKEEMRRRIELEMKLKQEQLKAEQEQKEREEKERQRQREEEKAREREREKAREREIVVERERERSRNILEVINDSLTESFAAISLNGAARKPTPPSQTAGLIASATTRVGSAKAATSAKVVQKNMEVSSPPWVKRYFDYSAKYGLGYQLHDGTVGAFFNDATKIAFLRDGFQDTDNSKGFIYVCYTKLPSGESKVCEERYILANYPATLTKKVNLLKHFSKHLKREEEKEKQQKKQNREEQGQEEEEEELDEEEERMQDGTDECVLVEKWLKTKHAVVFRLSNRVIQMNFFDDTKVVLSAEGQVVTYIDKDQQYTQSLLSAMQGPLSEPLTQRLKYTKEIIHLLLSKRQKATTHS